MYGIVKVVDKEDTFPVALFGGGKICIEVDLSHMIGNTEFVVFKMTELVEPQDIGLIEESAETIGESIGIAFSNAESLDVVIKTLEKIKLLMSQPGINGGSWKCVEKVKELLVQIDILKKEDVEITDKS